MIIPLGTLTKNTLEQQYGLFKHNNHFLTQGVSETFFLIYYFA